MYDAYSARTASKPSPVSDEPDEAAGKTDDAGFDEELREHLASARTERAAQANLARLARELREQQTDRVDEAYREEREAEAGLHFDVARDDLLVLHPRVDVEQAIVERTLEAAELLLLVDVVVEERLVLGEPRGRVELDPHLHPDAIGLQVRIPAIAGVLKQLLLPVPRFFRSIAVVNGMKNSSGSANAPLVRS